MTSVQQDNKQDAVFGERGRRRRQIEAIAQDEALKAKQPLKEVLGLITYKPVKLARCKAMWRAREETDATLAEIGAVFGNRAVHAVDAAIRYYERTLPKSSSHIAA